MFEFALHESLRISRLQRVYDNRINFSLKLAFDHTTVCNKEENKQTTSTYKITLRDTARFCIVLANIKLHNE